MKFFPNFWKELAFHNSVLVDTTKTMFLRIMFCLLNIVRQQIQSSALQHSSMMLANPESHQQMKMDLLFFTIMKSPDLEWDMIFATVYGFQKNNERKFSNSFVGICSPLMNISPIVP